MRVLPAVVLVLATVCGAGASSSGPIRLSPAGDAVWVVNPDSNTVACIDPVTKARTGETAIGRRPRTVAPTATAVYVTTQDDDRIWQLAPDGTVVGSRDLGFGCAPYGVVANATGDELYVSCQGSSTL